MAAILAVSLPRPHPVKATAVHTPVTAVTAIGTVPRGVARPVHLDSTYVAPPAPARSIGRLLLPRLGIDARVVAVGWDRDAMAVPNDPGTLGWFTPSARLEDLAGASLIAGHVADPFDRPGALALLARAQLGDVVVWRGVSGKTVRFTVVTIHRYSRSGGLPATFLPAGGPHLVRLVTCTHRVRRGTSVHYTENLVVTAVRT
ncbi:MAG: class F sortase [Marmoricola sp.]